jgi:hypothetical protein
MIDSFFELDQNLKLLYNHRVISLKLASRVIHKSNIDTPNICWKKNTIFIITKIIILNYEQKQY